MTIKSHYQIPVTHLGGERGFRHILVKYNEDTASPLPIYIAGPQFGLLDEQAAFDLANALIDIIETRRGGAAGLFMGSQEKALGKGNHHA